MGIRYKIIPGYSVVVVVQDGYIIDEKKISFYKKLIENSEIESGYAFLVDHTNAKGELLSSDAIQPLAEFSKQMKTIYNLHGKAAIIAPRDITYGLTRMYQAYADEIEDNNQVFRDAQKAVDWLGIPMSVLEEVRNSNEEDLD
ncbi:hypothetical protein DESC_370019 [Desulfosarcina cetonica]|uniref:hypothetical protein n=1 Tax=Desulfosarcina cetonica TaxID=90730 RepID=UPI0006CF4E1B|nr:hypothetical protein [Desulfosarcina cetonica]VTR65650.1 hypothetical protein DESC_370019 [Desulfosarcina cetonica]